MGSWDRVRFWLLPLCLSWLCFGCSPRPHSPPIPPRPAVVGVEIEPAIVALSRGATCQLRIIALHTDGTRLEMPGRLWTSSDPAVASVNEDGLILGAHCGTATISSTCDVRIPTSCEVSVCGPSHTIGEGVAQLFLSQGFSDFVVYAAIEKIRSSPDPVDKESFLEGFTDSGNDLAGQRAGTLGSELVDAARDGDTYDFGAAAGTRIRSGDVRLHDVQSSLCPQWSMWPKPKKWAFMAGFAKGYGQNGPLMVETLLIGCAP